MEAVDLRSQPIRFPAGLSLGAIAQLGERVLCKHEVVGSIPSGSTRQAIAGIANRDWRGDQVRPHQSFAFRPG
jgi:hypothetical protein